MPKLRHALTGGVYELRPDGLVGVAEQGRSGVFYADGRWHSGELRHADPQMIGWIGGPRLGRRREPAPAKGES